MAKSFFEVFPQLKLDTDLHGMLDDATVSKVSTTRQRNSLRIYLGCGRLLPKEKIYFLESELKRQLFPHHTMNIKIIEHFQLSEQYTLKNLLDVYWSSILTEFHRYSLLEYNLLRSSKSRCGGGKNIAYQFGRFCTGASERRRNLSHSGKNIQ